MVGGDLEDVGMSETGVRYLGVHAVLPRRLCRKTDQPRSPYAVTERVDGRAR